MENVVSARRLRKSALRNANINLEDIGISNVDIKKKIREREKEEDIDVDEMSKNKFKINFKKKIMFKILVSINIVLISLVCNMALKDKIVNNKYFNYVINEYNKDYSKEGILNKLEEYSKIINKSAKYVIPENIFNFIKEKYTEILKPYILEFELKKEIYNIFSKSNVNNEKEVNDNNGVGGGEPLEETKLKEVMSATSIMESDVNIILSKNINIVQPVEGKITSRYGTREQIFDNVNPYHTGIDLANKINTVIKSSTDGIVVKTEKMNKYYGNNVEIEKEGIIFKYAHLNSISVKQGDTIKQGDSIGMMGSTGMSTGSHLHFEIRVNGRSVDPEKVINFN